MGASERTLARAFVAEAGVPFGRWRTLMRLQAALSMLAAGEPVSRVAGRVGYAHPERVRGRVPARDGPDSRIVLQILRPVWCAANASVSPASSAVRLTARAPCPTWPSARSSTGRTGPGGPAEVACCSAAHIL